MNIRAARDLQYASLFDVVKKPGNKLRDDLYASLVNLIAEGTFLPGQALPSSRQLASQLKLSRNTVVATYQQLMMDGLIVAVDRSAYRVNDHVHSQNSNAAPPAKNEPSRGVFAKHSVKRFPGSVIDLPRIYKDPRWKKCKYQFIFGQSDPSSFPAANWRQIDREMNSIDGITTWTREVYDADHPELVDELCRTILPKQGIWVGPDEVMITAGVQNGIYLAGKLLMRPGAVAVIEDPGYVDAGSIFRLNGATLAPVGVDRNGLMTDQLPDRADLIYCTPGRQFPTTTQLSLERRHSLLDYSERTGAYIIEDDYDAELPFTDKQLPSLRSMTNSELVVYLGSFSKALAPGLRIGYVVASAAIIRELRALRRMVLRNPPINNQAALGRFVKQGFYSVHVQRIRSVYQQRYETLAAALADDAPELACFPINGGASIWATLPAGVDAGQLQRRLMERSVFIENGDVFHALAPSRSTIRLGFSSIPAQLIPAGARILAEELAAAQGRLWSPR